MWWLTSALPALRRLRQENCQEFEVSLRQLGSVRPDQAPEEDLVPQLNRNCTGRIQIELV